MVEGAKLVDVSIFFFSQSRGGRGGGAMGGREVWGFELVFGRDVSCGLVLFGGELCGEGRLLGVQFLSLFVAQYYSRRHICHIEAAHATLLLLVIINSYYELTMN